MGPRRDNQDKKRGNQGRGGAAAEDSDGDEACEFSFQIDVLEEDDNEEEKTEVQEATAQEGSSLELQASYSCFELTEDQRLQRAGYKTNAEIREDLDRQLVSQKQSTKRQPGEPRTLRATADARLSATKEGEDATEAVQSARTQTGLETTSSTHRSKGRARRHAVTVSGRGRTSPSSSPPQEARSLSPIRPMPELSPPTPSEGEQKNKVLNDSITTIDTAVSDVTTDRAIVETGIGDEQVALAMARQPRWPLLQRANPFPHRRARHSTTRRAKQAKAQRRSMRHGSQLGVLEEGDSTLTDDETDETGATVQSAEAQHRQPYEHHGNWCLFWCWCFTTRMCMLIIACLVTSAIITLVLFLAVDLGGKTSDGETPAPAIRGITSPTMSPSYTISPGNVFTNNGDQISQPMPTKSPSSYLNINIPDHLALFIPDFTINTMQDPSSPQYAAYLWLLDHPDIDILPVWKQQQLLALVTFYYAFSGDGWPEDKKRDWLRYDVDECEWGDPTTSDYLGNDCHDDASGQYKNLNLDWFLGFNIAGFPTAIKGYHMPPEVSLLTRLESLGILNAGLKANLGDLLPPQLMTLTSLQQLSFKFNNIEGSIPSHISQLTNLQVLSFGNNFLTGTIPSQLAALTGLKEIFLYNNRLTGSIPSDLGAISSLRGFSAIRNRLTGTIPASLSALTHLEWLYLDNNYIEGAVPERICQLENITAILIDCTVTCPSGCAECECFE